MDDIVRLVIIADYFAAVFENATPYAFNIVLRLTCINERISDDSKGLAHEEVLFHTIFTVLKAALSLIA